MEQLKRFAFSLPPARRVVLWFIVIAGCILLFPVIVRSSGSSTCLYCRAEIKTSIILGWRTDSTNETAFTTWFREHRPSHEHRWISCGGFGYNIFSIPLTSGCRRGAHPITRLPWGWELEYLQSAKPDEVETFFVGILSTNRHEQSVAVRSISEPMWERTLSEYRRRQAR